MNALKAFKKEQQIKKQYEKLDKLDREYNQLKSKLVSGAVFEIEGKSFTVIVNDLGWKKDVSYVPLVFKGN
jgi:hypothetical protein